MALLNLLKIAPHKQRNFNLKKTHNQYIESRDLETETAILGLWVSETWEGKKRHFGERKND